jgi:sphingolipid delta-4 desaturase
MMVYNLPLTRIQLLNVSVQLVFDIVLVRSFSGNALWYLIMSSFLAGSLHPCAGHFIAEHYVFNPPPPSTLADKTIPVPETFSYYGALNMLTYNVGLHNEHHDFPAIPWSRLPALHELAKEFYVDLPKTDSWVNTIWQFMWDKQVGLSCRVKRKEGGRKVGAGSSWTEGEIQA